MNFPRVRSRTRTVPFVVPAYLAAQPLNTWFEVTGTDGAGGAVLNEYSGLARVDNKWVAAGAGGHSASDNRVVSIDLGADAPTWSLLKAASGSAQQDVAYYVDGKPSSSHTYHQTHGISGNRVMNVGRRVPYGQGDFNAVDAFDLTTNQWVGVVPDAPGTSGSGFANVSPSGYYAQTQDANGDLWCVLHSNGNVAKYTVATNSWSQPTMANQVAANVRYPWALDTLRGQNFGLAWGDGEGVSSGVRAVVLTPTTQIEISFNASSALTQFQSDAPMYAGMDYDAHNDRFLFYSTSGTNRVYVITPNAGTTWDMSILSASGALPASTRPLVKKLAYFPVLKTVFLMLDQASNIYALRVAA